MISLIIILVALAVTLTTVMTMNREEDDSTNPRTTESVSQPKKKTSEDREQDKAVQNGVPAEGTPSNEAFKPSPTNAK